MWKPRVIQGGKSVILPFDRRRRLDPMPMPTGTVTLASEPADRVTRDVARSETARDRRLRRLRRRDRYPTFYGYWNWT